MDVKLHPLFADSLLAREGADAIEACVHCGFCLATCPTYLDSRDERDSPRGRIYLVKELLESGASNATAQHHLDRCLTCLSCETTCPSGVQYGVIVDSGRGLLEASVPRDATDRLRRTLLRRIVPFRRRIGPLIRLGQHLRPLLPHRLRRAIPPRQAPITVPASGRHERKVLLLEGCVQSQATPATNAAARVLLDRLGVAVTETPLQGCCGALDTHLGARDDGLAHMRRNIDSWWPAIEAGADAILSTATGCGSQLANYARALAHDSEYATRAARVSDLAEDLASYLLRQDLTRLPKRASTEPLRVAVQVPCSQTHALKQPDTVSRLLATQGFQLCDTRDDHLCCGSAGSYSMLQPAMSGRLRERKLQALCFDRPDVIASANIGCQLHLAQTSTVPVRHWVEILLNEDERILSARE